MRHHRIGAILLISTVGLALPAVGASAAAAKAPCASQKKALQRASGERKTQARKRYKDCVLTADIKRQLTDQRLVGQRGDGQYVNWLFCANGKFKLETSDSSGTGTSSGPRWVVTQVKGSAKQWTAIVRRSANLRAGGMSVGVARKGAQYSVGIDRGGDVDLQGPVKRTADAAGCAAL